jgi:negative regulator of sigma E activity
MNDFSELEDQLRKLRPAQPSADLVARVERALAEETATSAAGLLPRERRSHFNWLSLGLGLAAAAALLMFALIRFQQPAKKTSTVASRSPVPATSTNSNQLIPAGLTQVVYHTRDEGLHFSGNSTQPMRRVRSQTRDTLQWRNPKTGATLRISYPREEVSLTPISGQ